MQFTNNKKSSFKYTQKGSKKPLWFMKVTEPNRTNI